jgi:hypothetical protein
VVLVSNERHLQAVEIAADTVKAEKHPGLDTVAALFLLSAPGSVHVRANVTVSVDKAVTVDVAVTVVSLYFPMSAEWWTIAYVTACRLT